MARSSTTFGKGCKPGPGRPRRATEADYLRTAIDAVALSDWREVVESALGLAKTGDAKARDFLRKILIGDRPPTPSDLAAEAIAGVLDQIVAAKLEIIIAKKFGGLASPDEIADEAEKLLTNAENEEFID